MNLGYARSRSCSCTNCHRARGPYLLAEGGCTSHNNMDDVRKIEFIYLCEQVFHINLEDKFKIGAVRHRASSYIAKCSPLYLHDSKLRRFAREDVSPDGTSTPALDRRTGYRRPASMITTSAEGLWADFSTFVGAIVLVMWDATTGSGVMGK